MKYLPMKPGDTVKIVLLNPDQEIKLGVYEQPYTFNSLPAKNIVDCPIYELDRIETRFEILDL